MEDTRRKGSAENFPTLVRRLYLALFPIFRRI